MADAPQTVSIEGLDTFIGGMGDLLAGAHTSHHMFLPEITLIDATRAKSTWGLHDLVKTTNTIFNGFGHIHQEYLKIDGEWKITRSHTSRLFVEEQFL